jgi:hypothetical protein
MSVTPTFKTKFIVKKANEMLAEIPPAFYEALYIIAYYQVKGVKKIYMQS